MGPLKYPKTTGLAPVTRTWRSRAAAVCVVWLWLTSDSTWAQGYVSYTGPTVLGYEELLELSDNEALTEQLSKKLTTITTTPFVSNQAYYRQTQPHRPVLEHLGSSLRVVLWNIERGIQFDGIKSLLTDRDAFLEGVRKSGRDVDAHLLLDQIEALQTADVLVLNEVDWGMKRSGYRHVARELAESLNMNWAYGVEFIEVDPISIGTEAFEELENEVEREHLRAEIHVDTVQLRALHGTAILSRYPIIEARLEPFSNQGYDWYNGEKKRISDVEKGKRVVAERVFLEKVSREIRRGVRTVLIATLAVPEIAEGRLTVAAPHLENRAKPKVRREQMEEVLLLLRSVANPIVIAGDLNTTFGDTEPTSIKREVYRRVGSSEFWGNMAIKYATGLGLAYDAVKGSVNLVKNQLDPTARHIPIVAPNPERDLFHLLEDFRFRDGKVIDFRGDKNRTFDGTEGTLANSNQRALKGFAPTFAVSRTIGLMGQLKLDWILVKSYLGGNRAADGPYRLAPHYARTMDEVNYAWSERLSDHNPISVDLPFEEPISVEPLKKRSLFPSIKWPK